MAFWVYILRCADGKFYTGHTDNLEHRIAQHQFGSVKGYTSSRLPVNLVWNQDFPSRYEALETEQQIKKWSKAKKRALIAGDWDALSFFAKPPKERASTSLDFARDERNLQDQPSELEGNS